MIGLDDLPLLCAIFNAASAVCLGTGYYFIRHHDRRRHRLCMISAVVGSTLFLVSYVVYHASVGTVHFSGLGLVRTTYLVILGTHTVLAAAIPFLVAITLVRALSARFDRHRKVARWTLPIWLYVSVTGVLIYILLYRLFTPIYG